MYNSNDNEQHENNFETQNNQFNSNPILSRTDDNFFEVLNIKISSLGAANSEVKAKEIAEIIDGINSLSKEEALFLMGNENQLVRSIAARAYVDKSDLNIINDLKLMVLDENEYIRDAAIAAICYFNSPELLDALAVATKDDCDSIKLRALTGIADLAAEYADLRAKNILHKFSEYENSDIRNFVNDELSMLK